MSTRLTRTLAILSVLAVPTVVLADCGCPQSAGSKDLLITTAPGRSGKGLVACGYKEEGSRGVVVRGSEFEVFRCSDTRRLLEFGALETVDLKAERADLHMTRLSNWPFGPGWSWDSVPVAEAVLTESGAAPAWKASLPKPRIRTEEIEAFLREYRAAVQHAGRKYAPDENVVGKLFVAMVAGNPEAKRLFWEMPQTVNLDGHAAELYNAAVGDYRLGTQRRPGAP